MCLLLGVSGRVLASGRDGPYGCGDIYCLGCPACDRFSARPQPAAAPATSTAPAAAPQHAGPFPLRSMLSQARSCTRPMCEHAGLNKQPVFSAYYTGPMAWPGACMVAGGMRLYCASIKGGGQDEADGRPGKATCIPQIPCTNITNRYGAGTASYIHSQGPSAWEHG